MGSALSIYGTRPRRFGITIPANSGDGATIQSLLVAAGYVGGTCVVRISALRPNSPTNRDAFVAVSYREGSVNNAVVSTDYTLHGEYIAAGVEYSQPSDADAAGTTVRSASASTVLALAVLVP